MECKISIILPVYNLEQYVSKCLDSLLNQTFTEFEVIIIDDGSRDRTGIVCDQYMEKDSRIQVIHIENGGVSAARNLGIQRAKGKYILFFDGDDYVNEECLFELYEAAEKQNVDAVLYGYNFVKDGEIIEVHLPSFEKDKYEKKEILDKVVPKFIGVSYDDIQKWMDGDQHALKKENTALWRSMVKRSLIQGNNLWFDTSLKVGEDTCFTTEYLSCADSCLVIPKCYYNLVSRESSTISMYEKNPEAMLEGKMALLKARRELTSRIKKRTGKNIEKLWFGTVVMSSIQLAFLLSSTAGITDFFEKYRNYKRYLNEKETQKAICNFQIPKKGGFKRIPFLFLHFRCYLILFFATWCMKKVRYEFQR